MIGTFLNHVSCMNDGSPEHLEVGFRYVVGETTAYVGVLIREQ